MPLMVFSEMLFNYAIFYEKIRAAGMHEWADQLPEQLTAVLNPARNGNLAGWLESIENLPKLKPSFIKLDAPTICVGHSADCGDAEREILERRLKHLHPWRKGPFNVFGVYIDAEWRSDWKWARLQEHIAPLRGKTVLDVGCGNAYHGWRALGAGASLVIGIDPTLLSVVQFHALNYYAQMEHISVLPLGVEALPERFEFFDTVFSMGLLYHRRSPLDHLLQLKNCLKPGGELVLETLVIEGEEGRILVPEGRYAKMRNVWFIPSVLSLELWLRRCGYRHVRCLDVTPTRTEEQRSTAWMRFESLRDFLHPGNSELTVEGLPAPRRAVLLAEK